MTMTRTGAGARVAAAVLLASAAATTAGCGRTAEASRTARFGDKPAAVTCVGYGGPLFEGRSTGRVSFRNGRTSFVDAASGRYTVIDGGSCKVSYDR